MRVQHFSRRVFMAGVAVAALATSSVLGVGPTDAAAAEMAALDDGFPNKPITIMVVDEPGSTDSVFATQLAEVANQISPVDINIQHRVDFSNFGTWEALAWVKDQELGNDGYIVVVYTLVGAVIDLLVIDMKKEVGVALDDMAPIAALEQVPFMLTQRADAPWGKTLDEFVTYAKEHPGEIRHITGGPGGGQDAAMQVWLRHLGVKVKDIVGGGSGERALTVAAGEGDITVSPVDVFMPHFQAGRTVPILSSGSNPVPDPWGDIPNAVAKGMKDDPFDQTRVLGVPATVPEAHREWLTRLFTEAAKDEGYRQKRSQTPGLTLVELGPDKVLGISQAGYDAAKPVMQEMGVYVEPSK